MRCYRLDGAAVLVEWARRECNVPRPDGTVLVECASEGIHTNQVGRQGVEP